MSVSTQKGLGWAWDQSKMGRAIKPNKDWNYKNIANNNNPNKNSNIKISGGFSWNSNNSNSNNSSNNNNSGWSFGMKFIHFV